MDRVEQPDDDAHRVDAPVGAGPHPGFSRNFALVVRTAGLTSLFWLAAGGLLLGWLWTRDPQPSAPIRSDEEALARPDNVGGTLPEFSDIPADRASVPGAQLIVPVQGVSPAQLTDTFTDSRANGGRSHDAIDIMAPAGTPVVAAAQGKVEKLFLSDAGGRTVYVRVASDRKTGAGQVHYYAHLASYAAGLREGETIARGETLGTVGSSGNASRDAPHLHFAVMAMKPGQAWYEGRPVNPYPLLTGHR